jgi:hypothetical protein
VWWDDLSSYKILVVLAPSDEYTLSVSREHHCWRRLPVVVTSHRVTIRPHIENPQDIAYDGNARVRRELKRNGVDLIEVSGSKLVRGSGGPRCMTATIAREPES